MKNLLTVFFLMTSLMSNAQTVTDIDGNVYHTITLGTQTWTVENLRTLHFSNGDAIATTSGYTSNDSTAKFQWAYNEDTLNRNTYGLLYTWFVVADNRNVCPVGWHVPSDSEWLDLRDFLGGDSLAGNKMKEIGTNHWIATDSSVSNSSGFTGLPGGFRGNPTGFMGMNTSGNYWSATLWGSAAFPRGYNFRLEAINSVLEENVAVANCGLSVRCIKNVATGMESILPLDELCIFPNPAQNKFVIQFPHQTFSFSITDSYGRELFLQKDIYNQTVLDCSHYPEGVYFLQIHSGNNIINRKVEICR